MSESEAGPPFEFSREQLRSAERLLRRGFGGSLRIDGYDVLTDRRDVVARLRTAGAAEAPASAILKLFRGDNRAAFDAADNAEHGRPGWRFASEWAGLELLDSFDYSDGRPRVAPAFYGGDPQRGLLLIEDAGDGLSLADALLGDDPKAAESALVAYVRALGRMHALTAGRAAEYDAIVDRLGRPKERALWQARVRRDVERLPEACDELEFEWSPGMVDDVQLVTAAMLEPGPFETYTHGDPCPDNDRLVESRMVFFDFERGGFRNAFLDGVYPRFPFPTCWCVNRMPEWLLPPLETAYRLELMKAAPELGDDGVFEAAIVNAAAFWLISTTVQLLPQALRLDQTWGISTIRQRLLYRFGLFSQTTARFRRLEALGAWAYLMRERMRAKWHEAREMPLYPAFREDGA